ncbi:MAG TPA: SRPBCC family protein [Chloroflexota bacterium]|jgi:uncharacterized protein YndB with AHSA1/START domain
MTSERSVTHATFVIERLYDALPARVFGAFADPAIKARWFSGDEAPTSDYSLDFRVGGREYSRGEMPDGPAVVYDARFEDIVPDQRIVTTYVMYMSEVRISVSVATVELTPRGRRTQLVYTEQGAYLDGLDSPAQREHGTGELLNALGKVVEGTR